MEETMTSFTKALLVHQKDIVHGDLTPVSLIHTQHMAEFDELLAEQYFG